MVDVAAGVGVLGGGRICVAMVSFLSCSLFSIDPERWRCRRRWYSVFEIRKKRQSSIPGPGPVQVMQAWSCNGNVARPQATEVFKKRKEKASTHTDTHKHSRDLEDDGRAQAPGEKEGTTAGSARCRARPEAMPLLSKGVGQARGGKVWKGSRKVAARHGPALQPGARNRGSPTLPVLSLPLGGRHG